MLPHFVRNQKLLVRAYLKRSYLHRSTQLSASANATICIGQRSYLHFFISYLSYFITLIKACLKSEN